MIVMFNVLVDLVELDYVVEFDVDVFVYVYGMIEYYL